MTHFEKIAGNLWAIVGIHNDLTQTLTVTLGEAKIAQRLPAIYRRVEFPERLDETQSDQIRDEVTPDE